MINKTLATISCVALTACGGGGSSESVTANSNKNTVVVTQNTFSAKMVYRDYCGNEQINTDAQLIVHNSDFTTKAKINAAADGTLSYSSDSENEHISIVYLRPDKGNDFRSVSMTTIIDQPLVDVGIIAYETSSKENCNCEISNFTIFSNNHDYSNYNVTLQGNSVDHYTSSYDGVNIIDFYMCPSIQGQWGSVSATLSYPNQGIVKGAFNESLAPYTDMNADITGEPVTINLTNKDGFEEGTRLNISSIISGMTHFWQYAYATEQVMFTFPLENTDYYNANAYHSKEIFKADNEYTYVRSMQLKNLTEIQEQIDLTLPTFDSNRLLALHNDNSTLYDFSDTSDYDFFNFQLLLSDQNYNTILIWNLVTPLSGNIPNWEDFDISDLLDKDEMKPKIANTYKSYAVSGYQAITDYQGYVKKRHQRYSTNSGINTWGTQTYSSVFNFVWSNSTKNNKLHQSDNANSPASLYLSEETKLPAF